MTNRFSSLLFHFREVCKNEFIIPLGDDLKELYSEPEMCHSLRSQRTESVRPLMKMTDIGYVLLSHLTCTNQYINVNLTVVKSMLLMQHNFLALLKSTLRFKYCFYSFTVHIAIIG